ncbi:MAG: methyl-accepting chemotaxis protein [Lachnospiraceae bacterium]|nr:methyl-accepting chemotaxis protein [Lachnospiraceae bacterium]
MNEATNRKVGLVNSISFKLLMYIVGMVIVVFAIMLGFIFSQTKNTLTNVYKNYTKNVAEAASTAVDIDMEVTLSNVKDTIEGGESLTAGDIENYLVGLLAADPEGQREAMNETFGQALGSIELTDVEGSYAYFVSSDGLMIYHPTLDKIGGEVANAAVKGLVARLQAGETPQSIGDGSVVYEYKGELKFAGYAFTAGGNMVIVTGDYDTVMTPINQLLNKVMLIVLILAIAALIALYFIIKVSMKPIGDVGEIIRQTADFDFRHNPKSNKLVARKDEFGSIAQDVRTMRANLRDIVGKIHTSCEDIGENVEELRNTTDSVDSMCTDNSATTEQLSAAMQETAASTDTINSNIAEMRDEAERINGMADEGSRMSDEIMARATDLRKTTENAANKTKSIYESVRVKADEAIESSKAVDKINELTNTIMAISSQTSLLALNASIEAARAGEAGRGFAVVATEIGNLADQTSSAVADINGIVGEVNNAVTQMSGCLEETTSFLEQTVLSDYAEFQKVSEQYHDDADTFKNSMENIKNGTGELNESIGEVAESISAITTTVNESANGVSDIAGKTADIVNGMATTSEKVDGTMGNVDTLEGIVNMFVLN